MVYLLRTLGLGAKLLLWLAIIDIYLTQWVKCSFRHAASLQIQLVGPGLDRCLIGIPIYRGVECTYQICSCALPTGQLYARAGLLYRTRGPFPGWLAPDKIWGYPLSLSKHTAGLGIVRIGNRVHFGSSSWSGRPLNWPGRGEPRDGVYPATPALRRVSSSATRIPGCSWNNAWHKADRVPRPLV